VAATKPGFDELVGELDYPMLVVTASAGGERSGCLVGFATQCSIDPARFAVYISEKNHTLSVASGAAALGVHFLSADDGDVAELFGGETGDEIDKVAAVEWHEGPGGAPLLDRCPNRFVGRVLDRHDAGDHVCFVLEPMEVEFAGKFTPLPFQRAKKIDPGHEA
jgi:flavin reductase (DIM6/NTAB) family NADH-FMN oxidoreductase RutF